MTNFWEEMEQGIKCIKLVEKLLKEEKNLLTYMQERGYQTASCNYNIARMEYALGHIAVRPNYNDYFHVTDNGIVKNEKAKFKLWVDDVRPAPGDCIHEWIWCRSVDLAKEVIEAQEQDGNPVTIIDIDHDAGEYANKGGDYIKLLDWLEETGRNYPIRIHSMNPVGVANMRRIIERNGWMEVK